MTSRVRDYVARLYRLARGLAGWALVRLLGLALLIGAVCALVTIGLVVYLISRSLSGWFWPFVWWHVIVTIGAIASLGFIAFGLILRGQLKYG
jgi:hypothetical protein